MRNLYARLINWLFTIEESEYIPRSRWNKHAAKVPLLMAMYVSSVLVGISTYNTFPIAPDYLRLSAAIIGGMAFDIILTSTVFSLRKNKFSYMTIIAALVTGLAIALDLYLHLNQEWLHATYIVMSTLFAIHLASTSGRTVDELERTNTELIGTTKELAETNEELSRTNNELFRTSETLSDEKEVLAETITDLNTKLENHIEIMLEKLTTQTKLSANEIIALLGGNRKKMLEKISEYRNEIIAAE